MRSRSPSTPKIAGENPTPLEVLLAAIVASLWVLVELQDSLNAAWYMRNVENRPSTTLMLQMVRLQGSANRRYLAAIKALAQVCKLQANTPAVQLNTQISVR